MTETTVLSEAKRFTNIQRIFTIPAVKWITEFILDVIREIISLVFGVALGIGFLITSTGPQDNSILIALVILAIFLALGYRAGEKLLEWLTIKWLTGIDKIRKRSDFPDFDGRDDEKENL